LKVEDVMSINPLTVDLGEFVTRARELMRENHIHCLPVVDRGKYQGMITVQDIISVTSTKSDVTVDGYLRRDVPAAEPSTGLAEAARAIIGTDEGRMPVVIGDGRLAGVLSITDVFEGIQELGLPDMPVRDVMTRKVVVCEPGDPISRVWRNMIEFNIFGFPVVRMGQEVIGMITRQDVLKRGYVRFERENEFIKTPSTVQAVMSTPAITVDEDDSVGEAAKIFRGRQIGRLPVLKGGRLSGIVDRYDVLKVCRRLVAVD
jgi:CBS domain-containing protein